MALLPTSAQDLVTRQFFAPQGESTKSQLVQALTGAINQGREQKAQQQIGAATTAAVSGTATDEQLGLLFQRDPAAALKVLEGAGAVSAQGRDKLAQTAFSIQGLQPDQQVSAIQQVAQQIQQSGGDPSAWVNMLQGSPQQIDEALRGIQQASLSVKQRTDIGEADRQFGLQQDQFGLSQQRVGIQQQQADTQSRSVASQIAERNRPKAPALTAKTKDLIAAGLLPGTPEFQSEMLSFIRKGTGTTVNIGAGEAEEVKQIAKVQGRRFEKIIQEGENATRILSTVNQFDNIDVATGALEPAKAATAAVFKSLGLDSIADSIANVSNAQALQSLTNRAVNDTLNAASGVQTDGDAARARKTVVNLAGDPRANKFISATIKAVALRSKTRADFISGLVDSGANTFSQANQEWNKFIKKNPSLSSVVKNPATGLPLYFHEFEQTARRNNPGVSQQEINNAWRGVHGN